MRPPHLGPAAGRSEARTALVRLVFDTHRGYTVAIMALRAVRSLIPVAILWIGKLIIDGVIAARGRHAGRTPDWWHLAVLWASARHRGRGEGLAAVVAAESLLGDLFANRLSVRLMQHAATLDLASSRTPRRTTTWSAPPPDGGAIGLFALLLSKAQISSARLAGGRCCCQLPWLLLLLPWPYCRRSWARRLSSRDTPFCPMDAGARLLDYLRYWARRTVGQRVKLFGLSNFLVGRYAKLSADSQATSSSRCGATSVSTLLVTSAPGLLRRLRRDHLPTVLGAFRSAR